MRPCRHPNGTLWSSELVWVNFFESSDLQGLTIKRSVCVI